MDWTRGAAHQDGDWIVLPTWGTDVAPREWYAPHPDPTRVFDLASIRTAADAVWFMVSF
jgi:hypothetical protein